MSTILCHSDDHEFRYFHLNMHTYTICILFISIYFVLWKNRASDAILRYICNDTNCFPSLSVELIWVDSYAWNCGKHMSRCCVFISCHFVLLFVFVWKKKIHTYNSSFKAVYSSRFIFLYKFAFVFLLIRSFVCYHLGMHFSQAVAIIQSQVGVIKGVQVLYSETVSWRPKLTGILP